MRPIWASPTQDVPADACACPPIGHRVLQAAFERGEPACDQHVPHAISTVARLRMLGLVLAVIGDEGGWPRASMWTATLTTAGREHIAQVLGVADVHAGIGGCGDRWDTDQRCVGCGAYRPLTDQLARARLDAMPAGPQRDVEVWASRFACERHVRFPRFSGGRITWFRRSWQPSGCDSSRPRTRQGCASRDAVGCGAGCTSRRCSGTVRARRPRGSGS
jgi:hypothetical protein